MSENVQKAHYEAMHDSYERHYYDPTSLDYRRRFIFGPFMKNLSLPNARIADIACGSGWNTALMRDIVPDATFHGYDISERACDDYARNTGFQATCCDLTAFEFNDDPFDVVMVVGGIHHMINDLPQATRTIAAMVKPGGVLVACEPNAQFFLNGIRNFWYRHDDYFEENTERPLTLDELKQHFSGALQLSDAHYFGGPGYFLILNSLVMRVPLSIKSPLAKVLTATEHIYNALPGSAPFPAFISRWKKNA